MQEYLISVMSIAAIYAILSLSLHLTWGQMGLVNLGIAAFFGIGGYASALLAKELHLPVFASVGLAVALSGLAGIAMSRLTQHLQDDYLAITTLGFAEIMRLVCLNEVWLTNGSDGISGIPAPFDRGDRNVFSASYLVLLFLAVAIVFILFNRVRRAPLGRLLRSIRDDQVSVEAAGKNVSAIKTRIFGVSAAAAGLAGALYVHYTSYISPDIFRPLLTIYIFLGLTLGGRGNTRGAVLGGLLIVALVEVARVIGPYVPGLSGLQQAALREIAISLIFIMVLIYRPAGILPEPRPGAVTQPKEGAMT